MVAHFLVMGKEVVGVKPRNNKLIEKLKRLNIMLCRHYRRILKTCHVLNLQDKRWWWGPRFDMSFKLTLSQIIVERVVYNIIRVYSACSAF